MSLAGSFISDSGSSSGNSLASGPAPSSIGGMPPMQLFTELSLMEKQQNSQQQQQIQLLEALLKASLLPPSLPQTLKQVGQAGQTNGFIDGMMAEARQLHSNSDGSDTQQQHSQSSQQRKRRRLIGNMDNTLDGLVAKRAADHTPIKKRYQTETEAIELPDDEVEIKRMEADPDVCTRMCSVCGYQGKWVSEMIRHKRVHTSERPFKCKYCNRTSKWKADLIRHVAKTHGIRVVSKYSRSKAFEMGKQGGGGAVGDEEATELTTTTADMDDVIILGSSSSFSSSSSDCGGSGHSTNDGSSSSGGGGGGNWHHHRQHQDENNNSIGAEESPIEGKYQVNSASSVDVGGGAGTIIHQAHSHHSDNLNSQYRKAQRLLNSSMVGGGRCQENGQKNHHHRTNIANIVNNNGAIHHHQQQKHPVSASAIAPAALAGGAAATALPSLLNFLGISQQLAATAAAGPLNPLNLLTAQLLMMENHHQHQRQQKERQQMAEEQQQEQKSGKSRQQKSEYKCALCPYEQLSFPLLVSHLHAAHGVAPFICQNCNGSFNDLVSAAEHFAQFTACLPMALKSNFVLTTASEDAVSEPHPVDNNEPVVNGRFQSHSLINSMMPFSKMNPSSAAAASAIAAASLFPSFASAALQFPHPANGLLAESLKNRPDCGSSPISILSNAASYSSLNSMEKTTEKQQGFKPSFTPSDTDLPSTVPVTNASASSRNRSQSSEIKKEERGMDEEDDEEGLLPSETEMEEQQHQKQQRNPMDDRKLHLGQLEQSAFTPVIHPSLCSAPGIIQGEQCAPPPCLTAATSLVAFGQLLAELQKHTLLTHQRNQQQQLS